MPIFLGSLLDTKVPLIAKQGSKNTGYNNVIFTAHAKLIGQMAAQYRFNLIDSTKERDPSVAKTVKKIVVAMIEMFFDQQDEDLRKECVNTFILLIENCFIDRKYGPNNKKAKDLVFQPLFDQMQKPKDWVSRQSTCKATCLLSTFESKRPICHVL